MRIAFILGDFPKLSETFILNQITGLIDRGQDVDIYSSKRGDFSVVHEEVKSYGLLKRVHYTPELPNCKLVRLLKAAYIGSRAFTSNCKGILRSLNVFKYHREAASLRLLYFISPWGGRDYDIIQCHFGPTGFDGLRVRELVCRNSRIVVSFHGYDMSSYLRSAPAGTYRRMLESIDCALPVSDYWRDKLISLGCSRDKIVVHRMGVDCQKLTFVPRSLSQGLPIRMLTVARLVEKKGLQYAIRAVAQLKDQNIEYFIIGDGPLRDECTGLIKQLGAERTIHLLGSKTQEQVQQLLSTSHLYLSPSVTASDGDQEGIPVSLMEAMASGLPVVSTFHSGIPELVKHETTGYLVPERDVQTLAYRLEYLIRHPEIWPDMGRAGRNHVELHYNVHKLNDRLVDIYNLLLRRSDLTELCND
jgi:colanic acid/amylovoran biosynthesis glycosyltransferase